MTPPIGYSLVWNDEFDGTSLNSSKWRQTIGPSSNVKVANSKVELIANPIGNFNGSAFISTPNTFKYGYFECSAQISTVQGIAFAFWLLDPGGSSPEIDIVERPGNASGYQNLCVFSAKGTDGQWASGGVHQSFPATATGFHKYALLWTASELSFYVDDVKGWSAPASVVSKCTAPLNIKLDICAGGCSFQGIIIPTNTTGSTSAFVEYVKVYQQGGPIPTPVLTSISVSPTTASINVGGVQQLASVCKDQNSSVMQCPTLTWSGNNSSIATVNSSGLVTGVSAGTVSVTANAGGKTSNISTITVTTTPTPTGSKFSVYQLGQDGVTVVKSVNGDKTAAQASIAVADILTTLG